MSQETSGVYPPRADTVEFADRLPDGGNASAWLTAIIESADDAIISKTLNGYITSWNKGAERIFGYTAEETVGKHVTMLIPADHLDEEPAILARLRAGARIEHYETVRVRKDGSLVDISLTVSPIKDESGKIIGASKIARDISERKLAESLIEGQRQVLELIVQSASLVEVLEKLAGVVEGQSGAGGLVSILLIDSDGLHLRHGAAPNLPEAYNRAVDGAPIAPEGGSCVVAAFRKQPVISADIATDPIWATYRDLALGHGLRACWSTPIISSVGDVLGTFAVYYREPREPNPRDLRLIQLMIRTAAIAIERERLINQLVWERTRLAYLFTNAPAFIATVKGPEHVFELTNPAYMKLIGHRDVIGKSVREALPDVASQGFFELLDNVFKTGEPYEGREMRLMVQPQPGGALEERFVDFIYQPISEADGTVIGIFAHGVDITEQVSARKQAEEANRLKDEFLATVSHELRTPLTSILGWARMLGDGQLKEADSKRALDTIQRNAQLQSQLIEDILDVSRIVTGKLRLEVRPLELPSVIEAAVESVLPAADAKEIRVQRVLDSGPSFVSGDANRLQQIIWNLLTNAIKFTPKGGRVQIRLERVNSHVEIIVTDTGFGIRPDVLPFIFDRFRQADSSTTRQYGGLGLGLAIVRHLVEMHGGTVEAESEGEGLGATFTVSLPLIATRSADVLGDRRRGREHPTASRGVLFERPPDLVGLHVLVVDDEEDTRLLVRSVLEQCAARVTTASSVAEGLAALKTLRPDVLLSDLGMPEEDGYSLIAQIRALPAEQGGRTPAAALTAYARVEDRMRVLRSGFQLHMPKPIEPAELVTVVASLAGWGTSI
jgi:PAS domain S-box-containing protein